MSVAIHLVQELIDMVAFERVDLKDERDRAQEQLESKRVNLQTTVDLMREGSADADYDYFTLAEPEEELAQEAQAGQAPSPEATECLGKRDHRRRLRSRLGGSVGGTTPGRA